MKILDIIEPFLSIIFVMIYIVGIIWWNKKKAAAKKAGGKEAGEKKAKGPKLIRKLEQFLEQAQREKEARSGEPDMGSQQWLKLMGMPVAGQTQPPAVAPPPPPMPEEPVPPPPPKTPRAAAHEKRTNDRIVHLEPGMVPKTAPADSPIAGFARLTQLQQAVAWSEILGPPVALRKRETGDQW